MARKKKVVRRRKLRVWQSTDVKTLRQQAGKKTLAQFARMFKRTPVAVQLKASKEGISLRVK